MSSHLDSPNIARRWRWITPCGMLLAAALFLSGCRLAGQYNTVDVTPSHAQNNMGHSHPLAELGSAGSNLPVEPAVGDVAQMCGTFQTATPANPVAMDAVPDVDCQPSCCSTCISCASTSPYPSCSSSRIDQALWGPPPAINFRSDFHDAWGTLADDAWSVVTWKNAFIMGAASGAAIGIHQDWDGEVRANTAEHQDRWGKASQGIGYLGDVTVQLPVLAGLYSYSVWDQNEELHDLSGTLISAYAVTTTATSLIKVIVNSRRPSEDFNGGRYGFPSYHTASSFAMASVLDEYYGPKVGLPAYALAGVIGWTRIDQRDHDLSDVVFGAVLGTVVGHSIAANHLGKGTDVVPYYDSQNGTAGVMFGMSY